MCALDVSTSNAEREQLCAFCVLIGRYTRPLTSFGQPMWLAQGASQEICWAQNETLILDPALIHGSFAVELKEAGITCCLWL